MRIHNAFLIAVVILGVAAGCSKPAEAPVGPEAAAPQAEPTAAAPAPEPTPEPAASAEPAAVVLPEGFAALYHVHPEMTLTEAETVNAETAEYKVSGELRIGPGALLNYYVNYFQQNGWEEDMVMEQEGTVVVSFKKDGHLQYVDAREGGIGMKITITTGQA